MLLTLSVLFTRARDKSLTLNIKSEQNLFSDPQNAVLFAFLSNLPILRINSKEIPKIKIFLSQPRLS